MFAITEEVIRRNGGNGDRAINRKVGCVYSNYDVTNCKRCNNSAHINEMYLTGKEIAVFILEWIVAASVALGIMRGVTGSSFQRSAIPYNLRQNVHVSCVDLSFLEIYIDKRMIWNERTKVISKQIWEY